MIKLKELYTRSIDIRNLLLTAKITNEMLMFYQRKTGLRDFYKLLKLIKNWIEN